MCINLKLTIYIAYWWSHSYSHPICYNLSISTHIGTHGIQITAHNIDREIACTTSDVHDLLAAKTIESVLKERVIFWFFWFFFDFYLFFFCENESGWERPGRPREFQENTRLKEAEKTDQESYKAFNLVAYYITLHMQYVRCCSTGVFLN